MPLVKPEVSVHTTEQLSRDQIAAFRQLFEDVFHKPFPEDVFERKYARAFGGRSFHSLMTLDGELIAGFSAIPVRYRYFSEVRTFAITADLMIASAHRGKIGRFRQLTEALYARLAAEEIAFVFNTVRTEICELHEAVSKWRRVGPVRYFVAPVNPLLRGLVRVTNLGNKPVSGSAFPIEKINDEAYRQYRYRIFPVNYKTVGLPGGARATYLTEFYYPIEQLPAWLRLGLILDVDPLTGANLDEAVVQIQKLEPRLSALAYQGTSELRPRRLWRVAERFEKQSWQLAGRILREDLVDARIFDIPNWNVNLANGDLL